MPTCEIWAALTAADNISGIKVPRVKPKKRERESDKKEREMIIKERESIIDRYVQEDKVMLIDKSTRHLISVSLNNNKKLFISVKEETYKRFSRDMKKGETQNDALTRILDVYDGTIST